MNKRLPLSLLAALLVPGIAGAAPAPIATDRQWDVLPDPAGGNEHRTLAAAGRALGDRAIKLAGVTVDRGELTMLARTPPGEPMLRAVRERLGRPIDLTDFLLFLDDLVAAHARNLEDKTFWVPSGRARAAGILLHPDDVFGGEPRRYGGARLALFRPARPAELEPAADGDPLGPRWTARFENPETEAEKLAAVERAHPGDFADRLRALLHQFRAQGAEAWVYSTVRSRERGYLIYGAFILGRADSEALAAERIEQLERLNREWGLGIPIRWRHPAGLQATLAAARAMANAYDVVYATERGARHSSHYSGAAVDFAVVDLPRSVSLTAPDGGARRTFDLSAPEQPRDLNLTPALIEWVERHFRLRKLRSDYPHWTDAAGG